MTSKRLTDISSATGVTLSDLIHIVITGDTSQDPAGSSYKASLQQVYDAFNISSNNVFTGNTSATCITDLYVTNVHGCSPITIHDNIQSIGSSATGVTSFAFGNNVSALGNYSHAEGYLSLAHGNSSHAEGSLGLVFASDSYSIIVNGGVNTITNTITVLDGSLFNTGDTVLYPYNVSNNNNLVHTTTVVSVSGNNVTVDSTLPVNASVFWGLDNIGYTTSGGTPTYSGALFNLSNLSSNLFAHAEGSFTLAGNINTHAEGRKSVAIGEHSHAEGVVTLAQGKGSHAEGESTRASGQGSHAEGVVTKAVGTYSHAEGQSTTTNKVGSHAEGIYSTASGPYSHAEGYNTTTSGYTSHSEGIQTIAIGNYSHSEGYNTIAIGEASHAEGLQTIATGDYSHVSGQYNLTVNTQSAFIIGNGTSDLNRSNLLFAAGNEVNISGKTITTNFRMTSGATIGYVLTSDALGNATWQAPIGGSGTTIVQFTGNTSASCITDLYVTNLNSCSPLHIQPTSVGDVYIGENGGINVGIGNNNPSHKLDVSGNTGTLLKVSSNSPGNYINIRNTDELTFNDGQQMSVQFEYGTFPVNKISSTYFSGATVSDIGVSDIDFALDFYGYSKLSLNRLVTMRGTGDVGINNSNPTARLHVKAVNFSPTTFALKIDNSLNTPLLYVRNSGNVGIGTSTPSEKLDISGKTKTINFQMTSGATDGYVLTSDALGNATWQAPITGNTSGLISVTFANALTLIGGGLLEVGRQYLITDRADRGIILVATTTNKFSLEGQGIFLNPDFQGGGDYSGVFDLTGIPVGTNRGVWHLLGESTEYNDGDIVFWDGLHYQCRNQIDFDGTNPSNNTSAYQVLPKTEPNVGYIEEVDFINYNFMGDNIIRRVDKRGNDITDTSGDLEFFQWGNWSVYENKTIGQGSFYIINQKGVIGDNTVMGYAELYSDENHKGNFLRNIVSGRGIDFYLNSGVGVVNCSFNAEFSITLDSSLSFNGKTISPFGSTFNATLDMDVLLSTNTLNIPVSYDYIGIFNLINNSGSTIDTITNLPSGHKCRFYATGGTSYNFDHTPIGSATFSQLVSNDAATNTIVGRPSLVSVSDFIEYETSGNFCLRTGLVLVT